jgi:glucose-6-phosphate 1-dehydrogenase
MAGDGALFTREDAVEAAWAVVDPVLKTSSSSSPLQAPQLGTKEADRVIAPDSRWHNPIITDSSEKRSKQ